MSKFSIGAALGAVLIVTGISCKLHADQLSEQRYHYALAKTAQKKNQWREFDQHLAKLGDYPLVPYLEYAKLKRNLDFDHLSPADDFLQRYQGSFLANKLRKHLLLGLAGKRRWHEYIRYYRSSLQPVTLKCHYLYARVKTQDLKALEEVKDIWIANRSLPKACDRLFAVWEKAGLRSEDIIWTRFIAAMDRRNRSLANYLAKQMAPATRKYADLYLRVDGYPHTMTKTALFGEQSPHMQQVIVHGIKRYARANPKNAYALWERYEAQQLFPGELSQEAKLYIVKRLIIKGDNAFAEQLISQSHELKDNDVIAGVIREYLRNQNWRKVAYWIGQLDEQQQRSDRWQYWSARAQTQLKNRDYRGRPTREIYRDIAQNRSFYGFMSADILGQDYALEHTPANVNPYIQSAVEEKAAMRRAKELWLTDNLNEAQAEWLFGTRNMNEDELLAAGHLARSWGWYHKGIRAMITAELWDHLNIRFPLAYEKEVKKVSASTKIEPTLIYAIARQESAFSEKARSSAGALGLMQLMPRTARMTANKIGIKHHKRDLLNAEHNMVLGSGYLHELLKKYDGNRILAAAAYNAGPSRVKAWTSKTTGSVPFDIWIETIPFKETRGYVQNVLAFSVIYAYRLGKSGNLLTKREAKSLL